MGSTSLVRWYLHIYLSRYLDHRRQRRDLFGFRVKLLPVTNSLITNKYEAIPSKNALEATQLFVASTVPDLTNTSLEIQIFFYKRKQKTQINITPKTFLMTH